MKYNQVKHFYKADFRKQIRFTPFENLTEPIMMDKLMADIMGGMERGPVTAGQLVARLATNSLRGEKCKLIDMGFIPEMKGSKYLSYECDGDTVIIREDFQVVVEFPMETGDFILSIMKQTTLDVSLNTHLITLLLTHLGYNVFNLENVKYK